MSEDENYCRNPDQSVKPWCYVQSGTGLVKEYCDIPSCGEFSVHFIILISKITYRKSTIVGTVRFLTGNLINLLFKTVIALHSISGGLIWFFIV